MFPIFAEVKPTLFDLEARLGVGDALVGLYFLNRGSPPLTLPCAGVEIGVDVIDALGDVL